MLSLRIPEAKEVIVGELAERGEWVVANVQTASPWPVKSQKVIYRGQAIWIMPIAHDVYPAVAIKRPNGKSREECERLLMRFLSALAWVEDSGILVDGVGGGSLPRQMGHKSSLGVVICEEFDLSYLPEPGDEKALLALALMREGRGLNHPGYSFLAFYRVIELAIGADWKAQTTWINDQLVREGADHRVKGPIDQLRKQGVADIGLHLYASGRCAMAHAKGSPVIDPDNPTDARRLWSERPIMLKLAQLAIEQTLGVETSSTVFQKHLYELEGFKKILGDELVGIMVRGDATTEEKLVDIPDIGIRIRRSAPYAPLANLTIKSMDRSKHVLLLLFGSHDDSVQFRIALDFANERLNFNLFSDIGYKDLGGAINAENIAEISRFWKEYFGNGQLHIVDAESGELISRKDAYLPVNMHGNPEGSDALIRQWKQLAADRRERDFRYGLEVSRLSQAYNITVSQS
jgi:hypothetical protein